MKQISGFLLKILGWKIDVGKEFMLDKAVVVMAPHTSMADFWIGRLAFWKINLPVRFLIKKELFWFPMGIILKSLGAIPVDRKKIGNLTESIVQMFREKRKFMFTITPEGTRNLNYNWKRGFYQIAQAADVPDFTRICRL
jgi:1-acyl-sn-glycerol-3-phosphate acyltransferase